MEKEILKQKGDKLIWQEKWQSFEEERQIRNGDWVRGKNMDVVKTQMGQYLNDFGE